MKTCRRPIWQFDQLFCYLLTRELHLSGVLLNYLPCTLQEKIKINYRLRKYFIFHYKKQGTWRLQKNVRQLIESAVGLLENLPYHIFKTASFVTVVHIAYRCNCNQGLRKRVQEAHQPGFRGSGRFYPGVY